MPKRFLGLAYALHRYAYAHVLQGGKGDGKHDEDDAVIAGIQFGGPKVRRLADAEDSSDGDGSGPGAQDSAVDNALSEGKGANGSSEGSKGKGKKRATSAKSDTEASHKFQPVRISGASPSGAGDVSEDPGGAEDDAGGNATAVDAPGSLLVSAIEAQAKREAERAKAAAAESTGTKIVVKQKKRRDKGGGGGGAVDGGEHKKRKKHKRKDKNGGDSKKKGRAAEEATAKAEGARGGGGAGLGGLNLLGSYASSSGSEGDAP